MVRKAVGDPEKKKVTEANRDLALERCSGKYPSDQEDPVTGLALLRSQGNCE